MFEEKDLKGRDGLGTISAKRNSPSKGLASSLGIVQQKSSNEYLKRTSSRRKNNFLKKDGKLGLIKEQENETLSDGSLLDD